MNVDPSVRAPVDVISRIRDLVTSGQLAEAGAKSDAALERYCDPELHELRGFIAQQTQHYESAVESCREAERLGASGWSNYFVLGLSLSALNRHQEASESFSKALAFAPQHEDTAVRLLDQVFLDAGLDAAGQSYKILADQNPSGVLRKAWARISFIGGNWCESAVEGAVVCPQSSARDWIESRGGQVSLIGAVDQSPVVFPPVVGIEQQSSSKSISSNQPYLAELNDVTIFYRSNIILTSDGTALDEVSTHPEFGRYVSHRSDRAVIGQSGSSLLLDVGAFDIDEIDTGIMLSGAASNSFGHWVPDFLPRLEVYENHPEFANLPIIVDDGMPASHYEYLRCIAPNPIIRIAQNRGLRCKKLIFSGPATFFPVHLLPNEFPSDAFMSMLPRSRSYLKQRVERYLGVRKDRGEKLYLSRRNMTWRRLSNDLEVSKYLERFGYRTINIETLPFVDQVRLLQSASSIVAVNGAALLNLIFTDPSTDIFVLSSPNLHDLPCFYGQMAPLGYRPIFICGESVGDPNEKHADCFIPLATLEHGLRSKNDAKRGGASKC